MTEGLGAQSAESADVRVVVAYLRNVAQGLQWPRMAEAADVLEAVALDRDLAFAALARILRGERVAVAAVDVVREALGEQVGS